MKDSYVPILYTLQKTQKRKKYLDGFICITGRSLRVYDEKKRFLDSYSITAHTTLDDDVLELSKCLLQVEDEHRELLRSIASTSTPIHSNRSARTTPSKPKPSSVKTRTSHVVTSDIQTSSSQVVKPSSTKLSVPEPDKEIVPVKTPSKSDLAKQPTQLNSFLSSINSLIFCSGKVAFTPERELLSFLVSQPISRKLISQYISTENPCADVLYAALVTTWAELLLPLLQSLEQGGEPPPKSTSYNISVYKKATVMRRANTAKARRLQLAEAERLVKMRQLDSTTLKHLRADTSSGVEGSDTWKLCTGEAIVYAKADLFVLVPQSCFAKLKNVERGFSGLNYTCYFFTTDTYQPTAEECQNELFMVPLSDVSHWLSKPNLRGNNFAKDYDSFGSVLEEVIVFHYEGFQLSHTLLDTLNAAFKTIYDNVELSFYSRWMSDSFLRFISATHGPNWKELRLLRTYLSFTNYFKSQLDLGLISPADIPSRDLFVDMISHVNYKQKSYFKDLNEFQQEAFDVVVSRLAGKTVTGEPIEEAGYCSSNFYLLRGVFGSGKSRVLTALLLLLLEALPEAPEPRLFDPRVLVVANTNVAVDNLLRRLASAAAELPVGELLPKLVSRVGSGITAPELHVFGESLVALGGRLIVFTTFASLGRLTELVTDCDYFPLVIVDEASQVTEPLLLCGLAALRYQVDLVLLAGDNMQLPPVAATATLGTSTFERLITLAEDRNTPQVCPATTLWAQYRCCHPVADLAGALFYGGRVCTMNTESRPVVKGLPLLSSIHLGSSFDRAVRGSRENSTEAKAIVRLVTALVLDHKVPPSEIGIITPYKAQSSHIEGLLRRALSTTRVAPVEKSPLITDGAESSDLVDISKLSEESQKQDSPSGSTIFRLRKTCTVTPQTMPKPSTVSAATVDSFQGSEKLVIIMSLVQSADAHFTRAAERSEHINFPNRVNVAITRAVSHLIVVQSYQFSGDNLTSYMGKMTLEDPRLSGDVSPWVKLIAYTADIGQYFIGVDPLLNQLGNREIEQSLPLFSELTNVQKEVTPIVQEPPIKMAAASRSIKKASSLSDQLLIRMIIDCAKNKSMGSKCILSQEKSTELLQSLGGEW
ncbi:AAA superfamily protein [Giardia duodenalis]|uniref:AAA superfamily protein n=1 Tax=Giardia intestinalis TaxID=5741 RepID=V6TR96_GIAIN|nr:AAA superfamily protein [Giardia intestinalis]